MVNAVVFSVRSFILFLITLLLVRILGAGSSSKMPPYKFVTYIAIAVIAALTSTSIISNPILGIIAIVVWVILSLALDYICIKSKKVRQLINGKETVIIKDGKVMEESLGKLRMTSENLLGELRTKNVFSLADVEFAVLEPTGDLNVLLKSDKKPITAHDMQRKVAPVSEPQEVILDGKVMDNALSKAKLNREWLNAELEKIGVVAENVFIGQVDSSGALYVDLFDDKIQVSQLKLNELLYANIEKSQAELSSFALDTNDENVKAIYLRDAEKLKKMMDKLEPYLLR